MTNQKLCAKCKVNPRQAKKDKKSTYSYCKTCLEELVKDYHTKKRSEKQHNTQTVTEQIESEIKQQELTTPEAKFKVSVVEPPKDKPLFFDIDNQLKEITRTLDNNESWVFLLKGEAGTGKTTLVRYLQWKYKKPIIRINTTTNTEAQELKGKYVIKRDDKGEIVTEWIDGLVTTALRHNCWLQIEEVNFMQREHQSIFYSLFDDRREIILEDKDGEIVSNQKLVAFLTMNPLTFLRPLLPAFKSRIGSEFRFNHANITKQKAILMQKYNVPEILAEQIAKTISLIRKRYDKIAISSREAESWAKTLKIKGDGYMTDKAIVLSAFKHTIALKLTDDEVISSGLISVAEAVIEGKLGYDEILNENQEKGGMSG